MVIACGRDFVHCQGMGTYVGSATLTDEHEGTLAEVTVTLATADALGERWFGSVQGLAGNGTAIDGREVVVALPSGISGKARVVIDLTGPEPVVQLVGTGRAPV
jgi:hypothetical protein